LENRTTQTSLGLIPGWLAAKGYCQSLGRDQRRRQPMDQVRQGRRRSQPPRATQTWSAIASEQSGPQENSRAFGARRRKLWVSWRTMDLFTSSPSDPARVWYHVPSSTRQPYSQRPGLDPPEADPARQAAQGSRNPTLEGRTLARVEKKAAKEGRTIIFIDESGVYLLPIVVRTYAPCGQTPILKEFLSYDHLSLIGAVTSQGRLFLKVYEHSITSKEVIAFLGQLQRIIPGLLLVIWDGIPTHRSKKIKAYLAAGAAKRIHLEQLPGYAPDLNPTEWVWSYLKVAELANTPRDYLSEMETLIRKAKRRMQRRPELIQGFIRDAGYEV
jgi:transposase